MNKTAELLIKLRKQQGLTQNDLALKIGVTNQAVSKWERGENLPDSMILLELSRMYNVTIEELLSGELKLRNKKDETKADFMIFVSAFLFLLSFLTLILFYSVNRPVSILSASVLAIIAVLNIIYVGLKEENR